MSLRRRYASTIAPVAQEWLASARQARLLNVFERACNLVDGRGEVLSLVAPEIGAGPFSLVVDGAGLDFCQEIGHGAQISIRDGELALGELVVVTRQARHWPARPDWEQLRRRKEDLRAQMQRVLDRIAASRPAGSLADLLFSPGVAGSGAHPSGPSDFDAQLVAVARPAAESLCAAISCADVVELTTATRHMAGLGTGLTPAGDDFLLGACYAAWIIHPQSSAVMLVGALVASAIPLTTSLSAAWLKAAGRGEASARWQEFFAALAHEDIPSIEAAVDTLLASGHTSGADALAGFTAVFQS